MEPAGGMFDTPECWSLDKMMAVWQLLSQFLTQSSRRFLQREPPSSDLSCPTSWVRSSRPAAGSLEVICRNLQQNKYNLVPMLPPSGEPTVHVSILLMVVGLHSPANHMLPLPWTLQVYEDAEELEPARTDLCFVLPL